jgi:hypothetical protein
MDELNAGPITLDLGAISDEPVAETWHTVEIERADYGLSRKQNLPKIFVMSRVIDEADPDVGRTIIWNLMLAGDGLLFTKRCFKALNYPEVLEYPTADALAESLVGLVVEVRVKHRVYQGAKQANVNNWRAVATMSF